jgi:hypothetical protein
VIEQLLSNVKLSRISVDDLARVVLASGLIPVEWLLWVPVDKEKERKKRKRRHAME